MKNRQLGLIFAWLMILFVSVPLFSYAQQKITIERALDIAEENNPSMKTQRLNLERQQLLLDAQRASLKSQFSLNLNPFSYSRQRRFDNRWSQWYTNEELYTEGTFRVSQPILLTNGEISLINTFGWQDNKSIVEGVDNSNRAFRNNLYLQFTQPIFQPNRQKMDLKELEYNYENAGINYALQRLRTEQSITSQFYQVHMNQENLNINMSEFENAQKNYDIIKRRVAAGLLAESELFQAEINLTTAESNVEQGKVTLENSKDALKQTLGMPLDENIEVETVITVNPVVINMEEAINYGLRSRMEIRQREISIAQSEMDMINVKAQNKISGNVQMSIGLIGDDEKFNNIYDNATQNPRISLSLSVPIFDWGARKARIRAQQTQQTIANLNYEEIKIDIELAIRQSYRRLENLSTQIEIAEKRVETAQRTYDLNNVRYNNGEINGLEISQYQNQLSTNKTQLLQSQINYKNELLNIKILSLYDFDKRAPVVPVTELIK